MLVFWFDTVIGVLECDSYVYLSSIYLPNYHYHLIWLMIGRSVMSFLNVI